MTDRPCMTLPNGDVLYEGDYGRTRDGRKVGPLRHDPHCWHFLPWDVPKSECADIERQLWSSAGKSIEDADLDIIAR